MAVATRGDLLTIKNIFVGEVWLCSGQSNMEMGVTLVKDAAKKVAAADQPMIRLFLAANTMTPKPAENVPGHWVVCTPKNIAADVWKCVTQK
jgi:sialate O-acetylesterase